jgi:preprotein translocase subunit SecA
MALGWLPRALRWAERSRQPALEAIKNRRDELSALSSSELSPAFAAAHASFDVTQVFALAAVMAQRILGLRMFDVQLQGALALQQGHIAEMQTGEGKTLAAVPAIAWYALHGKGVHVLTANDYLARRDAEWMGGIYSALGLSVGHIAQHMSPDARRFAYRCDVTYATANEVGFDYLRDNLVRSPEEIVQRPFAFAVIDEADSILIDEARIPLVIAGGIPDDPAFAYRVDALVTTLRPHLHFVPDEFARNVRLTDAGIRQAERTLGCGNLFDPHNLRTLTAVQDGLHAHALLRRNVDYIVRGGAIESVDEFKGRIAQNRRWPAGLHSAIEAKERLPLKPQGRILGSITVQNLVSGYERVCGMTGTAATQADEFWKIYRLPVTVVPTNRPVIRRDLPDIVFRTRAARDEALVREIHSVHETSRPILVGTGSIDESERLSRRLHDAGIPHTILNARNDGDEAAVVAQAGAPGAVTISTNMAGRGTDILLGGNPPRERERVVNLNGLYVIGTTRHEARRVDHQLRGRAGRQGDPGTTRFFLSLEDDLLVRFGVRENPDIDSVQRTAESQNLEIRQTLWKYESVIEHHRREVALLRREVLSSPEWTIGSILPEELYGTWIASAGAAQLETAGRQLVLATMDDLWADYLANVAELKGGIHWVSWGGRDPLFEFLTGVERIYADFHERLPAEIAAAFESARIEGGQIRFENEAALERGATWTYLTSDQPFGTFSERIMKGLRRKFSRR